MDGFGDDVREAQQGNAAEDQGSEQESDDESDDESDEESQEPDEVGGAKMDARAVVLEELKSGRNSEKLANGLSLLTSLT